MDPGKIKNLDVPEIDQQLIELGIDPATVPEVDGPEPFDDDAMEESDGLPEGLSFLSKAIEAENVCDLVLEQEDGESTLDKIGKQVVDDYGLDKGSCDDWYTTNEKAMELAKANPKTRSFPWQGSANVIVPLIQQAAIAYNARVYPEVFRDGRVAKTRIFGNVTPEKSAAAERVEDHLNYDLLFKMKDWESDTDRMLMVYPIVGTCYRKVYFDPIAKRNVSKMLLPDTVIVNNGIDSLDTARRITHKLEKYGSQIKSLQRAGLWRDIELNSNATTDDKGNAQPEDDPVIYFLEQHRWLDLDDDGIDEPYVVTVHQESQKVVRIVARFTEEDVKIKDDEVVEVLGYTHFQDYHFVPAPDGTFLSYGFGALIGQLNRAANATLNSLLNAGTMANVQGGFLAKNFRMKGGEQTFQPAEWRKTDVPAELLKDSILPLPIKEPSQTLMALFGKLIEMAQAIVQVANINLETMPANAAASSTLAVIEQQSKTFNALFKRFYRGLNGELRMISALNKRYLDESEEFAIAEKAGQIQRADYAMDGIDIIPVADPQMTTAAQRMATAQAVFQLAKEIPGSNVVEAGREILKAMGYANVDNIIKPAGAETIPPEIQQQMAQQSQALEQMQSYAKQVTAELQAAQQLLLNKDQDNKIKAFTALQDATLKQAQAVKYLAEAREKGVKSEIAQYEAEVSGFDYLRKSLEAMFDGINIGAVGAGMAVQPGNAGAAFPFGAGGPQGQ